MLRVIEVHPQSRYAPYGLSNRPHGIMSPATRLSDSLSHLLLAAAPALGRRSGRDGSPAPTTGLEPAISDVTGRRGLLAPPRRQGALTEESVLDEIAVGTQRLVAIRPSGLLQLEVEPPAAELLTAELLPLLSPVVLDVVDAESQRVIEPTMGATCAVPLQRFELDTGVPCSLSFCQLFAIPFTVRRLVSAVGFGIPSNWHVPTIQDDG